MAGPGGGPPRRSHTKSRKGCEACKKRHIRCDESFPQCRNCTKHKVRCPYNDGSPGAPEFNGAHGAPDLMWTPEIRAAIEQWRLTGQFPFPNLRLDAVPDPNDYTDDQLRLIHHVASICNSLDSIGAGNFTIWTRQIPAIISVGAQHRYVMQALLAFSATHIAFLTGSPTVGTLAYEHRGDALQGLQKAIGDFKPETSDAILAASLVLSWQATDWRSWNQLMSGTTAIIASMESWKHESQFIDFINESSTFPAAARSPSPGYQCNTHQPSEEDQRALNEVIAQLVKLETHVKHDKDQARDVARLINFLKGSRKVSTASSATQQFERLRPLRDWLFYLPVSWLQDYGVTPTSLVVIAYHYTAALLMERLFPEIGTAYFGSLSITPVEDISRQVVGINVHEPSHDHRNLCFDLMKVPNATVTTFKTRMGWIDPSPIMHTHQLAPPFYPTSMSMSMPAFHAESPYLHSPYANSQASFSHSHDSLPGLLNTDGAAASPVSNHSPHPSGSYSQFLGVPSPNWGAYSPASSTFEGSVTYSDHEGDSQPRQPPFDWAPLSPATGGSHMYARHSPHNSISSHYSSGLGFVSPPVQPIWN